MNINERFVKAAGKIATAAGAVPEGDRLEGFSLATGYGPLTIHPLTTCGSCWIALRFREPGRVKSLPLSSFNEWSGKWNIHAPDDMRAPVARAWMLNELRSRLDWLKANNLLTNTSP